MSSLHPTGTKKIPVARLVKDPPPGPVAKIVPEAAPAAKATAEATEKRSGVCSDCGRKTVVPAGGRARGCMYCGGALAFSE